MLARILYIPVSLLCSIVLFLLRRLDDRLALGLAAFVVHLLLLSQRHRRIANMRKVFPGWSGEEISRLNRDHLRYLSRLVVDVARLPYLPPEDVEETFTIEGLEHLTGALEEGRGTLIIGSHLGSWWHIRASLSSAGYPITNVSNPVRIGSVESHLDKIRKRFGVQSVPVGTGGSQAAATAFGRNQCFSTQCDIVSPGRERRSIILPILGAAIMIDTGPAALALRHGVPVVWASVHREKSGRYVTILEPARLIKKSINLETDAAALTHLWMEDLSRQLCERPEEWWHWSHLKLLAGSGA